MDTHSGAHKDHDHGDHDHHSPGTFRDRFWLSLALTLPILYLADSFQTWFPIELCHLAHRRGIV